MGNEGALAKLRKVLDSGQNSTVVLSHEGVTNQLNRMSHETTADFQAVTRDWELVVYLVTRKPETWLASYWKQCVINPPVDERYATTLDQAGLRRIPSVRLMTDREAVSAGLNEVLPSASIHVCDYESANIWADLCRILGVNASSLAPPQFRESLRTQLAC